MAQFFVTVGANPFGAAFLKTELEAVRLAEMAKQEFPESDVVAWNRNQGGEPFEVWENGNPAN